MHANHFLPTWKPRTRSKTHALERYSGGHADNRMSYYVKLMRNRLIMCKSSSWMSHEDEHNYDIRDNAAMKFATFTEPEYHLCWTASARLSASQAGTAVKIPSVHWGPRASLH